MQANPTTENEIIRLDVLYGVKVIYPDLACRLTVFLGMDWQCDGL